MQTISRFLRVQLVDLGVGAEMLQEFGLILAEFEEPP
jgi:hypothetical protein